MKFKEIYDESLNKPEEFWKKAADDIFWFKKPSQILNKSIHLFINGLKMG